MSRFLRHIRIERYGALTRREIGPFSPGLNVVYGPNEAGKSTFASFVGDVLFGWNEARGVHNTYRPQEGGRSGALEFADVSDGGSASGDAQLVRNENGLQGDTSLLADIDQGTFRTLFMLTSGELQTLRAESDTTARLLTASSGTASSPAGAFVEIEQRIAAHTARIDTSGQSVLRLAEQMEEKRAQIREAGERADLLKQEDRELRTLKGNRADAAARVEALNREIADLIAWRAELDTADAKAQRCEEELAELRAEAEELAAASVAEFSLNEQLLKLDAAAERALRDKLDELAETRDKAARIVDTAKENSATSTAAYEALVELDEAEVAQKRRWRDRPSQALVSVLLPIAFMAAGVPLFMHGRQINSLSFTAFGTGLAVFALLLAAAAVIMLLQPANANALENRRKDAQWVMLQDKKKLDASTAELARIESGIRSFLDGAGLSAANGSLRQARSLLDDAREARANRAALAQRHAAVNLKIDAKQAELSAATDARRHAEQAGDFPEGAPLRAVDEMIDLKSAQRDALLEMSNDMSLRYGELSRELEQARNDRNFDHLKLEYQQIRTRLRESKRELIELLLAKRILERSIAAWESQSQPEVYAQASRLLAIMTDGAWVKVAFSSSGSLETINAHGAIREPRHLSLGTRQQLYLALRIALLLSANRVGRAIPVLADDILVNFDADRRRGAARALAELAATRQVIVFTCHRETVAALREAAPNLAFHEL